MFYILDELGYIEEVSTHYIERDNKTCTEYAGAIPEGYETLDDWVLNANIRAYKLDADGNLIFDADRDAALQEEYNTEPKEPTCYYDGDKYIIPENAYINIGGCVTSSKKQIRFGIFLPKSLKNIKSITVDYAKIAVRYHTGGYLLNMVDVTTNVYADNEGENAVYLRYETDTAFTCTNNIPVSVEINGLELTFNE
jgi:hypothetical protein